jgi:hypothetical protein
MQPSKQSKSTQISVSCPEPLDSTSSSRSSSDTVTTSDTNDTMRPNMSHSYSDTSGASTPNSTRSAFSYESDVSSSSSSASKPKRSSLKPSLKSSESLTTTPHRKPSPPTVRFAEPELSPKSHTRPKPRPKTLPEPLINRIPNPLLKSQYRHTTSFASPTESFFKQLDYHQTCAAPPLSSMSRPVSLPTPQADPIQVVKKRNSKSSFAPTSPSVADPRWAGIPLPANFIPPTLGPKSRVASYQSTISTMFTFSTQSAPATLETPTPTAAPSGQYNPLEHYVLCLHSSCTSHYTPAHLGPAYYSPQAPYSLSRLHGYCTRHASAELNKVNLACKKEYEVLRQNAGRKTMPVVAAEFEFFKEGFREKRRITDAKMQKEQSRRVLGTRVKGEEKGVWDWKYTPRPCTTAACKIFYTPYANHLYLFYSTPLPSSSFLPQQTLCPGCAKTELESFEHKIKEKWGSRCGWDEREWNEWFANAVHDRKMEQEYWIKAQERIVRENGPARWVGRVKDEVERVQEVVREKKEGRRGVFRRVFGSSAM